MEKILNLYLDVWQYYYDHQWQVIVILIITLAGTLQLLNKKQLKDNS